ncbi:unnamed protein product [Parascedosporium putredinis]|uniref:F-box domain-containing protein n=1 Tax=Parascedosporium putredinis TaxID=1442378 RepID=A0A9P1M8K7_9PEZI|nr:unnamed protein product [Parascedosporium putredinis]CAI7989082.1 unnamed protein product [Parascedosporium putredinis]
MSLDSLPTELLCNILCRLDPIGLISRRHFVERLLALEADPRHGGPPLSFRSRDNHLDPGTSESGWDAMRWACTQCMRLRPHTAFGNHALLRLRYRKPRRES